MFSIIWPIFAPTRASKLGSGDVLVYMAVEVEVGKGVKKVDRHTESATDRDYLLLFVS